jgi:uncharacterized protein YcbX
LCTAQEGAQGPACGYHAGAPMTALTLSALQVFPIKSLRAIAVASWEVGGRGLYLDREFMVIDEGGRFVTQREQRAMALLAPAIAGDQLIVRAPDGPPLAIPLAERSTERVAVSIWKDELLAEPVGAAADAWLSRQLGIAVRLVRFPADGHRQVDLRFARPGDAVGFADGFSFLLASEASLAEVAARLGRPLSMARFRPNLVIAGSPPFAEDGWRRIRVGAIELELRKPCARCVMVNVDPETGAAGVEPLRTLAGFRQQDGKVLFGWNLVHRSTGALRVGDPVEVLA